MITCEDGRKLANESIFFNLMYYVIVAKKVSRAMVLLYFKLFACLCVYSLPTLLEIVLNNLTITFPLSQTKVKTNDAWSGRNNFKVTLLRGYL